MTLPARMTAYVADNNDMAIDCDICLRNGQREKVSFRCINARLPRTWTPARSRQTEP